MTYAGVSRPASGVEHYFSHVWDMRGLDKGTKVDLHGIQCALGTLLSARLYEAMKSVTPDEAKAKAYVDSFSFPAWCETLRSFVGAGAEAMIAQEAKEGKYVKETHAARFAKIRENWDAIVKIIDEEIPTAAEIEKILVTIGIEPTIAQLEEAEKNPARAAYFREQAAAVANASISTIDAFCSKIVFRHFFCAGLSPSCKTLDETEAEVLRSETRNAVLDDFAQNRAEEYRTLIIAFSDEPSLIDAMQSAERFLCAQPDPNGWLSKAESDLRDPEALKQQLRITLKTDQVLLERHLLELDRQAALLPPACEKVLSLVSQLLVHGRGALMQNDIESYAAALSGMLGVTGSLSWPKEYTAEDKAGVADAKSDLLKLAKEQLARCAVPFDEWLRREREAEPVLSAFFALMHAYLEAFAAAKRAQNALDFSDLEHMTIEILKDDEIAAEYRARFSAVIVDEYQDSNRVQEAILNRIAPKNSFFFVGDVKQSIYRFRMAEPELFLEKTRDFHGAAGERIDLGHNFRSGKAVIDTVNAVFETIMHASIAGIEYDARARLIQGAINAPDGKAELHLFSREADPDDGESLEDAEAEARFAARTILSRMEAPIRDGDVTRPCRFDDFAILLRSKKYARVWTQTL